MIAAGSLNRKLTIYRQVTSRSATGTETSSISPVATVWASRESLNLRDATRMAGTTDATEAKFIIRYRSDLTTSMEVSCENTRYGIIQIDELKNREGLALLVRAL